MQSVLHVGKGHRGSILSQLLLMTPSILNKLRILWLQLCVTVDVRGCEWQSPHFGEASVHPNTAHHALRAIHNAKHQALTIQEFSRDFEAQSQWLYIDFSRSDIARRIVFVTLMVSSPLFL